MLVAAGSVENPVCRCREFLQHLFRAGGSRQEFAAAVRAFPHQDIVRAIFTKRAFERADERILGIRGQILIATFTSGAKFKHFVSPVSSIDISRQYLDKYNIYDTIIQETSYNPESAL
jgi:hypothetical protein